MNWELAEDTENPGDWRAEAVGEDGECYVTIFSGPSAETRAREYIVFLSCLAALELIPVTDWGRDNGNVYTF